jgi:hypothetical protein
MDPETYYFDDEPRNAIRIRAGAPGMPRPLGMPIVRGVQAPPTVPTYAMTPAYAPTYQAPVPVPVYAQAHALGQLSPLAPGYGPSGYGSAGMGGLFRRPLSFGRGASLLAQIVASLMPLPSKPSALGKVEDDVANALLYQQALAQHAQRDERIRTIGAVVAELAELV